MKQTQASTLIHLLKETGVELDFVEGEGWDWIVKERDMQSVIFFPSPEEAIANMVKHLIANNPPTVFVGSDFDTSDF